MLLLDLLFGRRRDAAARVVGPADEDVDMAGLGLTMRTPAEQEKHEPVLELGRPPAAIRLSAEEQDRIENAAAEKEAMVNELEEVGTNLKNMMSVVLELQQVVSIDYDSLSDDEKQQARNFLDSLKGLVIREPQPAKQAA
jgi:hypothetical protein